jgi:hypothetical protein
VKSVKSVVSDYRSIKPTRPSVVAKRARRKGRGLKWETTDFTDQTAYVLTLRPEPGTDPVLAVKALLKAAGRRFGLRCIAIRREPP